MAFSGDGIHHPVIAQNLYRLESGRLEQLGQSWIKHAFASATEDLCCNCQPPGDSLVIGVGCADTYGACQNGVQGTINFGGLDVSGLGPRSDVNPTTGAFPWPYTTFNLSGNVIYKRLQVPTADLDPSLHPGARYFAEVQYVGPDEGGVGLTHNNSSYREVAIGIFDGVLWPLVTIGSTFDTSPAIQAWQDQDPGVTIVTVDDAAGGRYYVASRATDNGDGTWSYEYALYNQNSNLPARSFRFPREAGITLTAVGFHDVNSHSGEAFDSTDWTSDTSGAQVSWSSAPGAGANVLRWGTMYSFWLTADRAPAPGQVTLDLSGGAAALDVTGIDLPCGAFTYCEAVPHSAGGPASIGWTGSTSFVANSFGLTSTDAIPGGSGLFFYGQNKIQAAFGDGFRCAGGMTFRLNPPVSADGAGVAMRALDFTLPPLASGNGAVLPGSTWNFQHWFRDTMGVGGSGFNLSDGLSVTFCP